MTENSIGDTAACARTLAALQGVTLDDADAALVDVAEHDQRRGARSLERGHLGRHRLGGRGRLRRRRLRPRGRRRDGFLPCFLFA